jgi:hypothetical protein
VHFYTTLTQGEPATLSDAVHAAREAAAARHWGEPAWAAFARYGTLWRAAL